MASENANVTYGDSVGAFSISTTLIVSFGGSKLSENAKVSGKLEHCDIAGSICGASMTGAGIPHLREPILFNLH